MIFSIFPALSAALVGLDQSEIVTIPSLPDAAEREAFTAARIALGPKLSLAHPAERYRATKRWAA